METVFTRATSTDRIVALSEDAAAAKVLAAAVFYGLLLLIFLTAIPYGTVEPWSHAAFECGAFFLGLLWVAHSLLSSAQPRLNLNLFYPVIALAVFAVLQSVSWRQTDIAGIGVQDAISADPSESWLFALRLSGLILAGILANRFTNSIARLSFLVHAVILVAILSAVFGIVRQLMQHQQGFLLQYLNAGGGFGQFINKNHFAFLVEAAMGLLIGLALLRRDGRRDRLLVYLSGILFLWVALVMSRSRGGLLAVTVQAICAALLIIDSRLRGHRVAGTSNRWAKSIVAIGLASLAMLIITVAGVIWLGGDQLSTGIETATIELSHEDAGHEGTRRSDIWRATWRMARTHPLFGAGLGGFWAELPQYHDASGTSTPQQAHNDYLELLASAGLVGAAILIWFVVILVRCSRSAFQQQSGLARGAAIGSILGLIGIAVQSLVEFGLHVTINALVFMILLAILSLPKIDQPRMAQGHRSRAFN